MMVVHKIYTMIERYYKFNDAMQNLISLNLKIKQLKTKQLKTRFDALYVWSKFQD